MNTSGGYADLVPDVLINAPSRLDETVIQAIRYTTIDLCQRGQVWQIDFQGIVPLPPDNSDNWLLRRFSLPDTGTEEGEIPGNVVDVRWLRIRGRTLDAQALRALDELRSREEGYGASSSRRVDDPMFYAIDHSATGNPDILLFPWLENTKRTVTVDGDDVVQSTERYEVRLALKPPHMKFDGRGNMVPADGIGLEETLEEYRETIVNGATSRLLRYGEDRDYERAEVHRRAYERDVKNAGSRARGRTAGTVGVVRYGGIGGATEYPESRTVFRRRW